MKKRVKILSALALSAALICTLPVIGNAAAIRINESSISFESVNKDWKEISDKHTFHTFTNGTDIITVLKYEDYDDLPAPARTDDKYEAVYQTFYCAGDDIYVVTGSAVKASDISEVKEIIDSITYPEASSGKSGSTAQSNTSSNTSTDKESSTNSSNNTDSSDIPYQGWDSIVLYDTNLNEVTVTRGNDGTGNWYDANGVSYGNLDTADESAPIYNSNGEVYYWNGAIAQAIAGDSSEETDNSSEGSDSISDVNDPYDLYSWDSGTNSFIPYQQAGSDGASIGRGNGWYYYDADTNNYLSW